MVATTGPRRSIRAPKIIVWLPALNRSGRISRGQETQKRKDSTMNDAGVRDAQTMPDTERKIWVTPAIITGSVALDSKGSFGRGVPEYGTDSLGS